MIRDPKVVQAEIAALQRKLVTLEAVKDQAYTNLREKHDDIIRLALHGPVPGSLDDIELTKDVAACVASLIDERQVRFDLDEKREELIE